MTIIEIVLLFWATLYTAQSVYAYVSIPDR